MRLTPWNIVAAVIGVMIILALGARAVSAIPAFDASGIASLQWLLWVLLVICIISAVALSAFGKKGGGILFLVGIVILLIIFLGPVPVAKTGSNIGTGLAEATSGNTGSASTLNSFQSIANSNRIGKFPLIRLEAGMSTPAIGEYDDSCLNWYTVDGRARFEEQTLGETGGWVYGIIPNFYEIRFSLPTTATDYVVVQVERLRGNNAC